MKHISVVLAVALLSLSGALAADAPKKQGPASVGEIRKVNRSASEITIKHGPLLNLDMPAMTMVFKLKDPALLGRVKAGDRVMFDAEMIGGDMTVTRMEVAK